MASQKNPVPAATRQATGFAVEPAQAETVRRALREAGLLATELSPRSDDGKVVFPLHNEADADEAVTRLMDRFQATRHKSTFKQRTPQEADYRERLAHLEKPLRDELPRAHDVVGDIVLVKLPDSLEPYKQEIGAALLATHTRLRTVALDRGVIGAERVRDLVVLAGQPHLATTHREHGLRLDVELDRVYFSPRLATERARLLERVQNGQRVLDLFAGVGAFVCLVARERAPEQVTAIDVNPHAVRLMEKNLQQNHLARERVTLIEGDAREAAPQTRDWDHVVLNLPHDAHAFLDVAAACVAPHGEIHLYAILEREDEEAYVHSALDTLHKETGRAWTLAQRRHVRQYAPTMDGLGFTFAARTP